MTDTPRPPLDSMRPPMESRPDAADASGIDREKLLAAWVAMTLALQALVDVTEKHERDNETTRRDNARTRMIALVTLFAVVLIAASATIVGARIVATVAAHCIERTIQ